jgi:nucleoside-diphosphate-sugar epimerase
MPVPSRSVLVLGAQGRLGSAAVAAFLQAGWQVHAQARRGALSLPLSNTTGLTRAAAGASVVVYGVNPLYTRWDDELLPLARQGMNIAQSLGALFVLPGNVYSYGESMPALLQEDTPERPSTPKGQLRQQLESELAERAARGDLRSLVLRAGDFYGHGLGSWLDLFIVKNLAKGKLSYPGPLDVPHAWAYLPDFARALVAVAQAPAGPAHERLHFPGHTATGAELLAAISSAAQALGWPKPKERGDSLWAMRLIAPWVPMLREILTMRYLWQRPHALDGTRLRERLPQAPGMAHTLDETPLHEALKSSLRALELLPTGIVQAQKRAPSAL